MSQKRQAGYFDPSRDRKSEITTLMQDYAAGYVVPLHYHDRDQLVYASRGVMTVRTGAAMAQGMRIEDGLFGGEDLIVNPPADLKDGDRVKVKG